MAVDKTWCLNRAIDIAKEYARGAGDTRRPEIVLEDVYKKLLELGKDALGE